MHVFIDIETIPGQRPGLREEIADTLQPPGNMKKAETIATWEREEKPFAIETAYRKTSFDGSQGHVVCIAWALEEQEVNHATWNPFASDDVQINPSEADLLATFFRLLQKDLDGRHPCFIGHNVKDFDLRFLWHRAVILGVNPWIRLPHDAPPRSDTVFDTMTEWAGWGNRIKLDQLCKALGIPGKGSELGGEAIDGSKVWDYVQAGRIADIATYCRADVARVREVYRRMNFTKNAA